MLTFLGSRSCIESVEIEPRAFAAGIPVLATGIPSSTEEFDYFSDLLQIQNQKGQKNLNPAAEQRSSSQGCTVKEKAARGQSSL